MPSSLTLSRDFPKLKEWPGAPWKKQTEFVEWMNKVMTYANGVHSMVGRYVAQCLQDADVNFTQKRGLPDGDILSDWTEVDHKLVAVCLEALPERLSSDCYRQSRTTTFTMVLYNIFCMINPGGSREIECLTKFVREPIAPGDAAGVREMLENGW